MSIGPNQGNARIEYYRTESIFWRMESNEPAISTTNGEVYFKWPLITDIRPNYFYFVFDRSMFYFCLTKYKTFGIIKNYKRPLLYMSSGDSLQIWTKIILCLQLYFYFFIFSEFDFPALNFNPVRTEAIFNIGFILPAYLNGSFSPNLIIITLLPGYLSI